MNEKVISIIERAVDDDARRQGHQGDYGLRCPFCNHHKKKLWVNFDPNNEKYGWWQCWVCGESGKSLFTLLKGTNASKRLFKQLSNYVDAPKYATAKKDDDEEDFNISLPESFRPLWKKQDDIISKHALNRLEDRGLSYGDIVKHQIGYCRSGKYSKRMIVPSYDREEDLNYFVGRRIWSSQFPKYKNPSAPRNEIIPFNSTVNWREPVTIVEGPFDAIATRRNAIPILGNKMPESLFCKLIKAETNEVNVALDADMKEVGVEIAKRFLNEGFDVKFIDLPDEKDPEDVGFEGMQSRIRNAEHFTFDQIVSKKLWS